ncbi:hypothetical protein N7513_006892 [Penicillium frequentans]|nr:hypothetical protein N7513_006892 [Penicillium glabrum]
MITIYNIEEGAPLRPLKQKRLANTSVERLMIYFIYLSNTRLPKKERLRLYKNPSSLSQYFIN